MTYLSRTGFGRLVASVSLAVMIGTTAVQAEPIDGLEIMAPSGPGGGFDMTARAIQGLLEELGLATGVQVVNVSGASGTVGLAQFASTKAGRGDAALIVGLVLQGGILSNKSPVTLQDVSPLARLIGEYNILVVPADSEIQSLDDLVAKLKADPQSVSWGGGGAGGVDHILAGLIGQGVGIDPGQVNYIAHDGGGQALASILGGHVTVGVNGVQEMLPLVASGKLRALAVSSPERLPGVDVPTLKEQGVDVEVVNWRGIVAPPGIGEAEEKALADAVATLVASAEWKALIAERGWIDLYLPAAEFESFLTEDGAKTAEVLKAMGLIE